MTTLNDLTPEQIESIRKGINKLSPETLRFIYNTIKLSSFNTNIPAGLYHTLLGSPLRDVKWNLKWAGQEAIDLIGGDKRADPVKYLRSARDAFPRHYKWLSELNDSSVFLENPELQKTDLKTLGFESSDEDYGLVNKAVLNFKKNTGKEVPVYTVGKSDAERKNLIPLNNSIYTTSGYQGFDDPGSFPTRLYRDSLGNVYAKSWDFFDHGNWSRDNYLPDDSMYDTKGLTTNSQKFGNLLDLIGNPFVRTTGYVRIPKIGDIARDLDPDNFEYSEEYNKKLAERIKKGEFDIKKLGGVLNYLNYLKSGGGIHIKPENKGKFTETKKRTGKTTEELTHSKNPLTRKRAIFAQTVKKWNHKK